MKTRREGREENVTDNRERIGFALKKAAAERETRLRLLNTQVRQVNLLTIA